MTQIADGTASFVKGEYCQAFGEASSAEGIATKALGNASHSEGYFTLANQAYSHAEGMYTIAAGIAQTVVGKYNKLNFNDLFIVGNGTGTTDRHTALSVTQKATVVLNDDNTVNGDVEHSLILGGLNTVGDGINLGSGFNSLVAGVSNTAYANRSYVFGFQNIIGAGNVDSVVEGQANQLTASGDTILDTTLGSLTSAGSQVSHVEGSGNIDGGPNSHIEGVGNKNIGNTSHIEGYGNISTVSFNHTEGFQNTNMSTAGHAEGNGNLVGGNWSHVEGYSNAIYHNCSHVGGSHNQSTRDNQTVIGEYANLTRSDTLFNVGVGNSDNDRKSALQVLKDGRVKILTGPVSADDAVIKGYADSNYGPLHEDRKVVYATTSTETSVGSGKYTQTVVAYSAALNNNCIVQRDGQQVVVPDVPTQSNHATSKKYVDAKTIVVSLGQVAGSGNDVYTTAPYIRFVPTQEQAAILANEDNQVIKLDLTALGSAAPAPYVWVKRNTEVTINGLTAHQFSCGGEQFWYDNYQTDIAIKNIGNGALVYVPQLILDPTLTPYGIADITLLNISIPELYASVGNKLDKTNSANKIYGTDNSGNQTTYDKDSFGAVNDVQVDGVSVVSNKVANIDLSGYVPTSRTIAGNALSSNISAQTLTDSLILCNDTTDIDYIMGD